MSCLVQHYNGLSEYCNSLNISIKLLTGSTKASERKKIHESLENGDLQILIGTHALLEDKVKFKNLGLAIIDEQHRFGVAQRSKLWKKNTSPPHILVMTATPIPRTLAMSVYGDLDISVIDELPAGRKQIKTFHRYDTNRLKVIGFIRQEIAKGRQIYIVFPLIDESAKLDYKNLIDDENIFALLAVAGSIFAYFSIIIVTFGDFSRYVKSESELKKGNLSLILNLVIFSFFAVKHIEWFVNQGVKFTDVSNLRISGADVWLFMSVTLFVIAQIFKRGIEMQEENELTRRKTKTRIQRKISQNV